MAARLDWQLFRDGTYMPDDVYTLARFCYDNGRTPADLCLSQHITDPHTVQVIQRAYARIVAAWDRAAARAKHVGPDRDVTF